MAILPRQGKLKNRYCNRICKRGKTRNSPGKSAGGEEGDFLGRRSASEDGIAMREAAEPCDDIEMQPGPPGEIGKAHGGEERHPAHLRVEIFRMLERHEEPARQRGR